MVVWTWATVAAVLLGQSVYKRRRAQKSWQRAASRLGCALKVPHFGSMRRRRLHHSIEGVVDGFSLHVTESRSPSGFKRLLDVRVQLPGCPSIAPKAGVWNRDVADMILARKELITPPSGDEDFDQAFHIFGDVVTGLAFLSFETRRRLLSMQERESRILSWRIENEALYVIAPGLESLLAELESAADFRGVSGISRYALRLAQVITPEGAAKPSWADLPRAALIERLVRNGLEDLNPRVRLQNLRTLQGLQHSGNSAEKDAISHQMRQHDATLRELFISWVGGDALAPQERGEALRWTASKWPTALATRLRVVRSPSWLDPVENLLASDDSLPPGLQEALRTTAHAIRHKLPVEGQGSLSLVDLDDRGAVSMVPLAGELSVPAESDD